MSARTPIAPSSFSNLLIFILPSSLDEIVKGAPPSEEALDATGDAVDCPKHPLILYYVHLSHPSFVQKFKDKKIKICLFFRSLAQT